MQDHSAVLDLERGQLSDIRPLSWQTDTSVSNKSWGYIKDDTFKSPEFVVHQLIDIVSKNGNLLLNIGPRSDGTIPEEVQQVLLDIGAWLDVNGDAIYGTRPWRIYGEGPTKVAAGSFHDTDVQQVHARRLSFHNQRRCALRNWTGLADKGRSGDSFPCGHSWRQASAFRWSFRQRGEPAIRAAFRWPAYSAPESTSGQVRICASADFLMAHCARRNIKFLLRSGRQYRIR